MKKAFDQTVRDLKREVNKKVLKVPGIEQKVLDATSNEPWGPHGTLLADIAQATRNYHEYQMIMSIIWKRISDIGKNWRHVYKGLTVLEYLVAHGSERVIDDIREHAYQISALADFQYIDSGARDQGNNVRRKSQSLVALVNDKERIVEVRQKAEANREKFRASSTSGMYRPGSYEGRLGSRDDDRNGYGREREWGSRDDDRSGRNGDSYGRDGDRYGRDYEDRYGRDGYKDDDYRGSNRGTGEYQHGSRSRSSERDRDRGYDDDAEYSSRGNGARVDGQSQNGRVHEQKLSEQSTGAPPSYEEAVTESQSPVQSERDGEPASSSAARASPQISSSSTIEATSSNYDAAPVKQGVDEFDPRGSAVAPVSAPPATSSNVEMDLLGSLTDVYSLNVLAIMPAPSSETDAHGNFGSEPIYGATASASDVPNQAFEHPFGDTPFKAIPSADSGDSSSATTYPVSNAPGVQPPTNSQLSPPESSSPQQDIDILADILPASGPQPLAPSQAPLSSSTGHTAQPIANYHGGFQSQAGSAAPVPYMASHTQYQTGPAGGNFHQYQGPTASSHSALQTMSGPAVQSNTAMLGNMLTQAGQHPSSTGSLSMVAQPSQQKFETKSTVWADTLSRGLVDLNISGSKTNPMADIGIDFAALNRKEKRMEKPAAATAVTSTISMGKAMGSGSGMGRAGATSLRPASNPMMGSGMAMGGGYRPMSQPMGMVMNSGMGMNMRMGQGAPMQPPTGMPPGYNPMMGTGGYASQQPYGGYR